MTVVDGEVDATTHTVAGSIVVLSPSFADDAGTPGGGGTTVHGELTGRDEAGQHSSDAITTAGAVSLTTRLANTPKLDAANEFTAGQSIDVTVPVTPIADVGTTKPTVLLHLHDQNGQIVDHFALAFDAGGDVFRIAGTMAAKVGTDGLPTDEWTVVASAPTGPVVGSVTSTDPGELPWISDLIGLVAEPLTVGSPTDDSHAITRGWFLAPGVLDQMVYTGTGLLGGVTNPYNALHVIEAILDRSLHVSGMSPNANVDITATAPAMEYGECVAYGYVWLNGQTDPDENATYQVNPDRTLTRKVHPDVFEPPGNGAMRRLLDARMVTDGVLATDTSLVSATAAFTSADVGAVVRGDGIPYGTTISTVTNSTTVVLSAATTATATGVAVSIARPAHGLTYTWFNDDRSLFWRAGAVPQDDPTDTGTWVKTFDPTASGGGGGVALGETSTTAHRGDRGKTAYDHSQVTTGNPHGSTAADVGAPATTLTISAGTGLTGGGDLTANRSLAVSFGLDTGTAAEGISVPRALWRSGSYYSPAIRPVNANSALASGVVRAMPFYNPVAGRTIDRIAVDVVSASGTPAGFLYVMLDDGTGYPGAVVASGSVTPAATTRIPTAVSYTLPRGLLYFVAHSTAATWAAQSIDGQSPYIPASPAYSTGPAMNCWSVTGAGTSLLTAFPAGGAPSNSGIQVVVRAA